VPLTIASTYNYNMKTSFKTLLLATAVTASSAFAQTTTTTNTFDFGDIMLGFSASSGTGAGKSLQVNLGAFQQFDNADGSTIAFSSSIVADLNATFGDGTNGTNDWRTSGFVKWSVIGTTGPTNGIDGLSRRTIFTTAPDGAIAPAATVDLTQSSDVPDITSMSTLYNGATVTANSTVSVVVDNSNAGSYFARVNNSPTVRFGTSNQTVANGTSSVLDFYAVVPTNPFGGLGGEAIDGIGHVYTAGSNFLGEFELKASGLTFTAATASAIPEPSTFGALAGAAVLGLAATRRRPAVRA
jgi:hypothetical protein